MGTQGPGRKRIPNREKLTAEDDALNQIAREAEARLAAKRAARAEAREIRMKELERQQKEVSDDEERMSVGSRGSFRVEEKPDRDFLDKGSRTASTLSAATLASLGGASSRRGSCDTSFSVDTEASIRDMKESLAEVEEKYRKAMVSNAQLHNDKTTLMYQVEALREELSDMEEELWESRRRCDDTSKELQREHQAHGVLQFHFQEMQETLQRTEELLTEVSDLRLRSTTFSQELSDLQEVLQWKEKKMAALERQREISDIVRIERDRLRDDVVRLSDLLKKHGVVVSSEVSTNGEAGLGEGDDDVSAESAARLAQEPPHRGRESALGNDGAQPPTEGSRRPQDYCLIYKQSQSLNHLSTRDRSRPDSLKPVRRLERRTEKLPGRNEGARKPRHKQSETERGGQLIEGLVSAVRRASRLVPPRPAKDMILDNKAMASSVPPTQDKLDLAVLRSSSRDVAPKCWAAVDCVTEDLENDGNACRGGSRWEQEVQIHEFSPPVSASSLRDNESVDGMGEVEGEGRRVEDEDQILTPDKDKTLKSEGDFSFSAVPESLSFKTKPDAVPPAETGTLEKLQEWRIYEEEAVEDAIQDNSSEPPEHDDSTETQKSQTQSPRAPTEWSTDWSGLEKTIQHVLRAFVENQSFAAEISRIFPDIPGTVHQWVTDFKERLQGVPERGLHECETVGQEPTGQAMDVKPTREDGLPLKDLAEGIKTSEDPEGVDQSAAGPSELIKDGPGSGMFEVEVSVALRDIFEDVPPANGDQDETGNTSEVTESSPRESPKDISAGVEEEERRSESDPMALSCSEDFVFVESYFAEPVEMKTVECGSDQGSFDLLPSQEGEVVTRKQSTMVHRDQSCLGPFQEVGRHRTVLMKCRVGQSSKVRRLIEMTDEIKAMAVPELLLMSLQDGRMVQDQQIDESTGLNTEDPEEFLVEDVDSCEEVDEGVTQQPAAARRQPVTKVVVEDTKVIQAVSREKHWRERKRFRKRKAECTVS